MGYYTEYTLSVFGTEKDASGVIRMTDQIPSDIEAQIDLEIAKMNVFSDGNIQDAYTANETWYSHEEDMRLLSEKFPNVVFWLNGAGEGYEDLWQKFFLNGHMQEAYAKIIYDDFDMTKLDNGPSDAHPNRYSRQLE